MKGSIVCALALSLAVGSFAEETLKPIRSMPSEVTLTSGRVLRKVEVIRWQKDRVVLKHAGGADPIAFSLIKSISMEDLEAMSKAGTAQQAEKAKAAQADYDAKLAAESAARAEQERFEKLIGERKIAIGMSAEQAERAWGRPDKKNVSGSDSSRLEQWVYRSTGAYLYVENGRVRSWQIER